MGSESGVKNKDNKKRKYYCSFFRFWVRNKECQKIVRFHFTGRNGEKEGWDLGAKNAWTCSESKLLFTLLKL